MKKYFDNSHLCWECTGSGLMYGGAPCKICGASGVLGWPLSLTINKAQPPSISKPNEGVVVLVSKVTRYTSEFKSVETLRFNKQAFYRGYN